MSGLLQTKAIFQVLFWRFSAAADGELAWSVTNVNSVTNAVSVCVCTHSDSGQQAFRHIGYHNGHEENHGLQKGVANEHGHHEEREPKENSEASDDVHKVLNLNGNRCLLIAHTRGQTGDSSNDCPITCIDNHTSGNSYRET